MTPDDDAPESVIVLVALAAALVAAGWILFASLAGLGF